MISIGIFGRRNVGKSSLINVLTGQQLSIVSDIAGTTTDPVKKSIELLDVGKAVIVDTAGFDDDTDLGKQRVEKTKQTLQNIDFAILIFTENRFGDYEKEWVVRFQAAAVPFMIVHNKSDLVSLREDLKDDLRTLYSTTIVDVSTIRDTPSQLLFDAIKTLLKAEERISAGGLLTDLILPNDIVVLVIPIDSEAPAGRLILPQVQTIRAILDEQAIVITSKMEQLIQTLASLKKAPSLVITDSQVFSEVEKIVAPDCRLTSFSILLARQKGEYITYLKDTPHIDRLQDGDKILILESCTHQHLCEDIGRVKLPNLLRKHTGKDLQFVFVSGLSSLPDDWETYSMVFQCGACMITQKQLRNRLAPFINKGIPTTNYGIALAYLNGIFDRVTNI